MSEMKQEPVDYSGWATDDLHALIAGAHAELDRRRVLAETPRRIAELYTVLDEAGAGEAAEAMVTQARVAEATRVATAKTESVEIEKKEERHEAGPTTEDS
jgi:hypothetical protein